MVLSKLDRNVKYSLIALAIFCALYPFTQFGVDAVTHRYMSGHAFTAIPHEVCEYNSFAPNEQLCRTEYSLTISVKTFYLTALISGIVAFLVSLHVVSVSAMIKRLKGK